MDLKNVCLFERHASEIANATLAELTGGELLRKLTLARNGSLTTCYAPFDFIAPDAQLVVVGITPGRTQAVNALVAASTALKAGKQLSEASRLAKLTGSFSGAMRAGLVSMLDHIGLATLLGASSCAEIFDSSCGQVHFTSALRYPVFVGESNYNGNPDMLKTPILKSMIDKYLVDEAQLLRKAVWLPLGPQATRALEYLCGRGLLDRRQVLNGLPHPSGANAERISYFLGRKSRETLSSKTDANKLDAALGKLRSQVLALSA